MSMRSGFSFDISALDAKPIDPKHVWEMLDATSYRDRIATLGLEPDQFNWVHQPYCNEIRGRFEDVHPEEFYRAFNVLTTQYPDRTFIICTFIDEKTEMVEPGEYTWLEKNGKTFDMDYKLNVDTVRLMPVILSFALANVDEYYETVLERGMQYSKDAVETILRAMVKDFDKVKDVF